MKEKPAFNLGILQRAEAAIAHGALTNSKRPSSFIRGVYPTHLVRGQGSLVWDAQGNRYIDFICGLGTNLFGYANTEIMGAISAQLSQGTLLSLGTVLEIEAAEALKSFFPFCDRFRFLKTGSEACTAAILIARANNPKSRFVLSEGYHGWHPEFTSMTPPARGVTNHQHVGALRSLDNVTRDVAAVIVEPIMVDASAERIEWLRRLRARCTEVGAFLIFDEVITGLRFRGYSVAQEYGITPDLICLGKALGGGLPLAAIGGRRELMETDYFVSSTHAGETLSLAAMLQVLAMLNGKKYRLPFLWERGALFQARFNDACQGVVALEGYATRMRLVGDEYRRAVFMQETARAGLLFGPSVFFNFPHIDLMDEVLSTVGDIVARIKTGAVALHGEMPQAPFAERVRR